MPDKPHTKPDLRRTLRRHRNALQPSQQRTAAESLVESATRLPGWADARHVAVYLAQDGEIDTGPLESALRAQNKQLYLPVISDTDRLQFAPWGTGDELHKNRYGIPEPPPTVSCIAIPDLDIIFMPLVGWDVYGNRLGMGGGFYDRTLSNAEGVLRVGLAHECQRVEMLPRDSWDISLEFVATDAALYRNRGDGKEMEVLFRKNDAGL